MRELYRDEAGGTNAQLGFGGSKRGHSTGAVACRLHMEATWRVARVLVSRNHPDCNYVWPLKIVIGYFPMEMYLTLPG